MNEEALVWTLWLQVTGDLGEINIHGKLIQQKSLLALNLF